MKFRYDGRVRRAVSLMLAIVAGPVEDRFSSPAVIGGSRIGDQGVGIPDVGQVDADQSGLVAVRGTAHVDDAGIGGVDGDGDVVIALREHGGRR